MSRNPVLENEFLRIELDLDMGGRVISFYDKKREFEQLWYDAARVPMDPALDYDGNFAGGMDELLPNDLPERGYPDHGELWSLPLECSSNENTLTVSGTLPVSKLAYSRTMYLDGCSLVSDCCITNTAQEPVDFLWKLHAALAIAPGDKFIAPYNCVQAADPGDWSKARDCMPRKWQNPYVIAPFDGKSDFFYLTDPTACELVLERTNGSRFICSFDGRVFPLTWVFASFGRLNDSRTLIMEPCTSYPISLDEAAAKGVCAGLGANESIKTQIRWTVK